MSENKVNKEVEEKTSDEVSLPNSRKIYVETNGSTVNQNKHNLKVPFREIALSPSREYERRISKKIRRSEFMIRAACGLIPKQNAMCAKVCRSFAVIGFYRAAMLKNTSGARFCRRTTVI